MSSPNRPRKSKRRSELEESSQEESSKGVPVAIGGASTVLAGMVFRFLRFHFYRNRSLVEDHLDYLGKGLLVLLVVVFIVGLVAAPFVLINALPGFFSFLAGSKKYRKRWLSLQLVAWIATICSVFATFSLMEPNHTVALKVEAGAAIGKAVLGIMMCIPAARWDTILLPCRLCLSDSLDMTEWGKK